MKRKKTKTRIYSFYSCSAPVDFVARASEEASKAGLRVEQTENGFDLRLRSHHGGTDFYRAEVLEAESGGSFINGEIVTVPWDDKSDDKNVFRTICYVLGALLLLPIILLCLLILGIYKLFVRLFRGKITEPTREEILCDFMINKMCCRKKEE